MAQDCPYQYIRQMAEDHWYDAFDLNGLYSSLVQAD